MKRSKYTEEQITFALKQAGTGVSVGDVCRKVGISESTFHAWRKKYGGLGIADLRLQRQLEEENRFGSTFWTSNRVNLRDWRRSWEVRVPSASSFPSSTPWPSKSLAKALLALPRAVRSAQHFVGAAA